MEPVEERATIRLTLKQQKYLKITVCMLLAVSVSLMLIHLSTEIIHKYIDILCSPLLMIVFSCIAVSFLFFPNGPIEGPLSPLWKTVNGICLFYLLGLIYLAFHVTIK